MHILITGAAGMIGRKLVARLVKDGQLNGQKIDRLTLIDVVAPEKPAGFTGAVEASTSDLSNPGAAAKAIAEKPDVIFHLAGVVSGEAEIDFEKGYRVNLDGTRALLEAIRAADQKPKVIFTSSVAHRFRIPLLTTSNLRHSRPMGRRKRSANCCSLTIRDEVFSRASASDCQPSAFGQASPTRRHPVSSLASSGNRWPARRPCFRFPMLSAIRTRARAPRWGFSSMPRD
jgi:NAD(P)-dependent dehydrogenase (short-subunit alcohol dehydrogenase family)